MHPESYTEQEYTRNSLIFDVVDSVQAKDAMEKFLKVFAAEKIKFMCARHREG